MQPGNARQVEDTRELREALILELVRSRPGFRRELHGDIRAAERSSRTCGDRISVRVTLRDGALSGVGWDGRGCAVSSASAAALSDLLPGTPLDRLPLILDEVRRVIAQAPGAGPAAVPDIGDMRLFSGMGRLPLRGRCALLPWEALADAVREPPDPGNG